MIINDEYKMLRQEILVFDDRIYKLMALLYSATAAAISFAMTQENIIFSFVPYVIIVPVYFLVRRYEKGIHKIAAYIIVFLENDNIGWETRLYYLNCPIPRAYNKLNTLNFPFILLDIVVTAMIIMRFYTPNVCISSDASVEFIVLINIVFIIFMCVGKSPEKMKMEYVLQWRKEKEKWEKNNKYKC